MLVALAETGNVTEAALAAKIDRCTHYKWLNADPAYVESAAEAMEQAADHLETEARRRAVDGVSEPLMYQGIKVGHVLKYSDTLLIFLLKAVRPEKYRDHYHVAVDANVKVERPETEEELREYLDTLPKSVLARMGKALNGSNGDG